MRLGTAFVLAAFALAGGCGSEESDDTELTMHETDLTLVVDARRLYHGDVSSEVRACEGGRQVILFKQRPGVDRKLGSAQSPEAGSDRGTWGLWLSPGELRRGDVYAEVQRKVGDGLVCRADRSETLTRPEEVD